MDLNSTRSSRSSIGSTQSSRSSIGSTKSASKGIGYCRAFTIAFIVLSVIFIIVCICVCALSKDYNNVKNSETTTEKIKTITTIAGKWIGIGVLTSILFIIGAYLKSLENWGDGDTSSAISGVANSLENSSLNINSDFNDKKK